MTRAPENLFWTLTTQRQLSANLVLEVGYNANVGTHLQTGVLNFNQVPTSVYNDLITRFGPTQALNILRADITSSLAQQAGIRTPYPSFVNQRLRTVAQALRPFPQYQTISTAGQNGDKSGHSTYHAFILKPTGGCPGGLTFQWNYVLSKLLTDSDTYFASNAAAQDHYNRGLEKSIGQNDQTHIFKFSTLWDLPFGKGRRWVQQGFLNQVIGGWRLAGIEVYSSGFPSPCSATIRCRSSMDRRGR